MARLLSRWALPLDYTSDTYDVRIMVQFVYIAEAWLQDLQSVLRLAQLMMSVGTVLFVVLI